MSFIALKTYAAKHVKTVRETVTLGVRTGIISNYIIYLESRSGFCVFEIALL